MLLPVIRLTYSCVRSGGRGGQGYRLISCRPNSKRVSRLPTGFNNRCREYSVQIYKSGCTIAADYPFYTYVLMKYFCRQLSVTAPQLRPSGNFCLTLKGGVCIRGKLGSTVSARDISHGGSENSLNPLANSLAQLRILHESPAVAAPSVR